MAIVPINYDCDCQTLGRDNQAPLFLSHHPNCEHYDPDPEIRELLLALVDGIETWAADEDGIHSECWDAYVKACSVVGLSHRPERHWPG